MADKRHKPAEIATKLRHCATLETGLKIFSEDNFNAAIKAAMDAGASFITFHVKQEEEKCQQQEQLPGKSGKLPL